MSPLFSIDKKVDDEKDSDGDEEGEGECQCGECEACDYNEERNLNNE